MARVYKESIGYVRGEWNIGRIYERRGFPEDVRFYWWVHGIVLTRPAGTHTDGAAATLKAAKAEFRKSWSAFGRRGRILSSAMT